MPLRYACLSPPYAAPLFYFITPIRHVAALRHAATPLFDARMLPPMPPLFTRAAMPILILMPRHDAAAAAHGHAAATSCRFDILPPLRFRHFAQLSITFFDVYAMLRYDAVCFFADAVRYAAPPPLFCRHDTLYIRAIAIDVAFATLRCRHDTSCDVFYVFSPQTPPPDIWPRVYYVIDR